MSSKLINPYNLLGLTTKSSLAEMKKAYYNLALLCHPDKGGSQEDMIIVQNAYNYIKQQLEKVDEKKDTTYEQLEKEFEDFCREQEDKPIETFGCVYEETQDWIKEFNREFKSKMDETKDNNPLYQGYGELMEPSLHNQPGDLDLNNFDCTYQTIDIESDQDKITNNFTQELIEYKEPKSLPDCLINYPLNCEKIDDYSNYGQDDKISMTDYVKAFNPKVNKTLLTNEEIETLDKLNVDKLYEEELLKRKYFNY